MGKFTTVEEYLNSLAEPLREIGEKIQPVIDAGVPKAEATIWHGHPTWKIGKNPVCYLKAAKAYLTFGFWKGQTISDPSGRLQPGARGMGQVKLRSVDDIDVELFTDWLRQAQSLESP